MFLRGAPLVGSRTVAVIIGLYIHMSAEDVRAKFGAVKSTLYGPKVLRMAG